MPSDAALAALAAQVVAPDGDAVRALAAGARVVAFGESTHGTREFAVLRADLTRALRSPRDTLDLVLEANMTAVGDLDRWIRTGQGDDAAAVEALGYWTWRTDEMRAMARALRERVARGHGLVRVWGVDIQDPDAALEGVRAYVERRGDARLRADLDAVASAVRPLRSLGARLLGTMDTTAVTRALATTSRLVASLEQVRSATGDADPVASRWAVQQARLLAQWSAMLRYGPAARDSAMAQNVLWILAQRTSSTPLVLWAHDGHVARETGTMGSVLAQRLGSGYRPVSLSMYQGRYSASGPAGLTGYDALPATAGTLEEGLHRLGRPSLLLDLRATGSEARPWLGAPLLTRRIGAVALESGYLPMVPAASFDALVFVDSTTRTSLRPSGSLARRWPTLLVMGGVSLLLLVGVWKSRRPRPSVVVLNAPRGASLA